MSVFYLLDCSAWVDGYDFSGDSNKLSLSAEVADLDRTRFRGGGWKSLRGGLKSVTAGLEGLWSDEPDLEGFGDLGGADRAVTISPTGVAGDRAYVFKATKLKYSAFGEVASLTPFTLDMSGSNTTGLVRGRVAAALGDVSATGQLGSVLNLGAVSSTQYLYAVAHVFGTPGTTITIDVESDDAAGMASPTTRGTLGPLTAAGGTWLARVAGPITDTYWRLNVSAITGTFTVAGAIAVQ